MPFNIDLGEYAQNNNCFGRQFAWTLTGVDREIISGMLIDSRIEAAADTPQPYGTYLKATLRLDRAAVYPRHGIRCSSWPDLRISDRQSGTGLREPVIQQASSKETRHRHAMVTLHSSRILFGR
jgi:hypothetical protein